VPDLEVRVAASSSNPRIAELIGYCTRHNFALSVDCSMPELMCWADLAVAAAGTTCLELCFCGLPAIVIDAAPNQLATARELQRLGVAVHVPLSQATDSQIAEKIRMLLGNHETLERMSRASKGLVDGRGAERVVAAIIAFSLKMRPADASDAQLLWEWTNDPAVRQASFKSTPVSWKEHEHWFAARLKDRESSLFVFDNPARGAAAAVRFEAEHPDVSKISITIAREYRGLGLAPHVIQRAVSAIFEQKSAHEIRAFVKPENTASSSAFQRAGFSFAGTTRVHECEALIYVLHRSDAQWLPSDAAEEVECG
jgi:RimJ/RimL family protein N-acetyltransferase